MELEDALSEGGDTSKLREKLVAAFSPDEIERVREKLIEKQKAGNFGAERFLKALPPKGTASLARPEGSRTAGTKDPWAPSSPISTPVPTTPGAAIEKRLQAAFPKLRREADPWQSDELAGMIGTGAMLSPLLAPAAGLISEAAPALGEAIGGVGGTVARGGVKLAGGAGMGAAASVLTDSDPKTGAIMGGLMAVPGAALDVIRDPRLPTGQIYEDLSKGGGTVSPLRGAKGGMFDTPAYRNLPTGEQGTVQMAGERSGMLEESVEARRMAAKGMMDEAETNASVRQGETRLPTDETRARIANLRQSNRGSRGEVIDSTFERHLDEMDDHLQMSVPTKTIETKTQTSPLFDQHGRPIQQEVTREVPGERPTSQATFRGAVNLKKDVADRAQFGQPGTLDNRAPRRVAGALSDLTRGADKEYDIASGRYAEEMRKLERVNDVTVGRDIAETGDRASMQRARVRTLEQAGTDKLKRPQLEEIAVENPQYAPLIETMIAQNAAMKLKLGIPASARPLSILGANLQAGGIRAIDAAGRLSNLNYPAIPLEVAAYEGAQKRRKTEAELKRRAQLLDTGD